jgi:hypothetical protein
MARRRIGQEDLIARLEPRAAASLAELAALLDWAEIDRHLAGISAAAKGEPGWPPLALFRALLLATWHDLSDIRLAEALDDRASFRRFCGFAAHEPTPSPRPSAPPSSASGASWPPAAWTGRCSRRSRASSRPRASRCAPEPWWTPP